MDLITRALLRLWPQAAVSRLRALAVAETFRGYEGASKGRRMQGWKTNGADANAAAALAARTLRDRAEDLVRNNPLAARVPAIIANNVVGWGIKPKTMKDSAGARSRKGAERVWRTHFETTACDFDGLLNIYGLQKLAVKTVQKRGSVLVRRRRALASQNLVLPLQLQILEPDFLDLSKDNLRTVNGGKVIRGVQFDANGRREGYWLFEQHPGSSLYSATNSTASKLVPATDIIHAFEVERPGQVDGVTWFAPVLVKFRDADELDDAKLLQQKIAACFAAFVHDTDGSGAKIGATDPQGRSDVEVLEPGMIMKLPVGKAVTFGDPPSAADYSPYEKSILRKLAKGCRVTYEQLTGDYSEVNFASSRMARMEFNADVEDWRWQMLIPMFCERVWTWAMEAALITGDVTEAPSALWTPPPAPFVDPEIEGKAVVRNVRAGIQTLFEAIRERGYDPEEFLQEVKDGNDFLDRLGIILDSDPRLTTQVGGPRIQAAKANDNTGDGAGSATASGGNA